MLGTRIATLRKHAGMTQSDLAKHIHVSTSTVGMYEQGRRSPNISILISLSQEFAVSIDYLILGTPNSAIDIGTLVSTIVSTIRKDIWPENQTLENQHSSSISPAKYQLIVEILRLLAG